MRSVFVYSGTQWTASARAFALAARGTSTSGGASTVVCEPGSSAIKEFAFFGLDVVTSSFAGSVSGDAWRLRKVLKDRFAEVAFVHTEREHLVTGAAMRLAGRGAVVRRIPPGGLLAGGNSTQWAERFASSCLLFSTEADLARAGLGRKSFLAPLGVSADHETARESSRRALKVGHEEQLIMCVLDGRSTSRVTTVLRTLALLAERHPHLRLALAGATLNVDNIRMHGAALGVTSLIRFIGSRANLPELLAAADVGWVAADGDDAGFACLDFMAARIPVIAERSPVVSHYVPDGIAGVLLAHADPSETASVVARIMRDRTTRDAMGNAGSTRAKRDFPEQAMVQGFISAAEAAGDRSKWAAR